MACHGPDAAHRESELRLDDEDSLTRDRGGYRVIDHENPQTSELLNRITTEDEDLRMPPPHVGKDLSETEIELLKRWIAAGAEFRTHWAYVAPKRHELPTPADSSWSRNWIDQFILSRLETEQLTPSADAEPHTLIRRVYFDLTGLPPGPAEVRDFQSRPDEQHYEAIVDHLLASDACAERLAAYWLDLVRFADTVGYHGDQDHNISPYRDWVIDAFADNMPFDQFTREQLAGDLLPNAGVDQKIATGYNRLLQTSHEGGVQPKEYLAIYAADRVRNLSAVWMGATVGCAQCHDHKYDPYTAKDFYSLAAFFADVDEDQHFRVGGNSLPTKRPPEIKVLTRRERNRLEELTARMHDVEARLQQQPQQLDLVQEKERLRTMIEDVNVGARLTMITVSKEPRVMRVLPRGNWLDDSGPEVQPAVPEFLGTVPASNPRATRLDLANWLVDGAQTSGKLTARVFVNRFWFLFFGNGIAPVLDDFGGQGNAPEHPELLDNLAMEFLDSGWNVKSVLKQIVMSRTYRQSSAWTPELLQKDPGNVLYARQSSHRLAAEMIRDNALSVSGLLVRKVGGPSVKPYQPPGYYRHLNFPQRKYSPSRDEQQWRRGVYVHWQRQFLHPMLKAFDAPSREECTARRPHSNTPLAALTLLNDPTFVEAARAFAARVLANSADSDPDHLQLAMQLALSREADQTELDILNRLVQRSRDYYQPRPDATKAAAGLTDSQNVSEASIELAAWTAVTRTLLNMDEFITRN